MARGRSLGPQGLRGKGVTPAVSSGGLRKFVSPIDAENLELAKTLLAQPTTRSTEAQFPSNQREEGHLTQNIINDYIRPRILPLGW